MPRNNNDNDEKIMTGPKMDALVAEKIYGAKCNGGLVQFGPTRGFIPPQKYSEEIEHAFEMEVELERRGLTAVYAHELFRFVMMDYKKEPDDVTGSIFWLFAHASPEQRCRAALACVEGK